MRTVVCCHHSSFVHVHRFADVVVTRLESRPNRCRRKSKAICIIVDLFISLPRFAQRNGEEANYAILMQTLITTFTHVSRHTRALIQLCKRALQSTSSWFCFKLAKIVIAKREKYASLWFLLNCWRSLMNHELEAIVELFASMNKACLQLVSIIIKLIDWKRRKMNSLNYH